jgi:hypothetical protein
LTIQQCFQTTARVQILLRDLHSGLARCYGEDRVLRETFIFLAREEEQRALRLRLLVKDRKGVLWSDGAVGTIHSNLVAILAELSAMAIEIQGNSGGHDPVPVLRRVMEMERRCGAIHAETLARNSDPEVRAFFASLAKPDVRVERLLAQAIESQAAPVHRRPVPEKPGAHHLAA